MLMGSVAVAIMPSGPVDAETQKLHPFFRTESQQHPEATSTLDTAPILQAESARKSPQPEVLDDRKENDANKQEPLNGPVRKRRRVGGGDSDGDTRKGEKQPRRRGASAQTNTLLTHFSSNHKNPETSVPPDAPKEPADELPIEPLPAVLLERTNGPYDVIDLTTGAAASGSEQLLKEKKILKFNPRTGTFGSPPKAKPSSETAPTGETRAGRDGNNQSLIACAKYGLTPGDRERIGQRITQIMSSPPLKKSSSKSGKREGKNNKPKHPFFSSKSKESSPSSGVVSSKNGPTKKATNDTIFMTTPGSPKRRRRASPTTTGVQFGIRTAGLKVPGAAHPQWPAQGMAHMRCLDELQHITSNIPAHYVFPSRKSKGQSVNISGTEDLVQRFANTLDLNSTTTSLHRDVNSTQLPPPALLRLPHKHFESGPKMQRRIRSQLKSLRLPTTALRRAVDSSDDELALDGGHVEVRTLFSRLQSSLSAFDSSDCESMSWTQKYAPCSAMEVLQNGKEGLLIKEWLQMLKIDSVDTGSTDSSKGKGSSSPRVGAPKKRRKKSKLDGFIVSTDSEEDGLDEISDEDDSWTPAGSQGPAKKSVVRSGDIAAKARAKDTGRLRNCIVISGPNGCGKTAAVYAIAKELDFEIFEINSSSRRSGKDVLERIGDMTQNHLVQQHRAEPKAGDVGLDEDKTVDDIKSGKQATMASFFKPKPAAVKQEPTPDANPQKSHDGTTSDPKAGKAGKTTTSKAQKQSLILLEEVDVLYEEDKQFWTTLIGLIAQSKRPFILTCNDESLLPIQALNLHAIFRFHPPPIDLAVDVLLLIAANEGHLLQRRAIEDLYESKSRDFRSSLTELNYWCQIGIGDRKGGMDWFYPRWPKGCDLDEQGHTVRVISEGSYQPAMGWMSRDTCSIEGPMHATEEELLSQAWDAWGVDLGDWHTTLDLQTWAGAMQFEPRSNRLLDALTVLSEFSDAMSVADVVSMGSFATGILERLDPTLPELPSKCREDYTLGRSLLDVSPSIVYTTTARDVATAIRLCGKKKMELWSQLDGHADVESLQPMHEGTVAKRLNNWFRHRQPDTKISRVDFSLAFDPIAVSETAALPLSGSLDPSVFDRTMEMITLDVAPFVRAIVACDQRLQKERLRLGSLLSEGGRPGKRMRKTRSSYSALEGGSRSTTRRENYFTADINPHLVLKTAGHGWQKALEDEMRLRALDLVETVDRSGGGDGEGDYDESGTGMEDDSSELPNTPSGIEGVSG